MITGLALSCHVGTIKQTRAPQGAELILAQGVSPAAWEGLRFRIDFAGVNLYFHFFRRLSLSAQGVAFFRCSAHPPVTIVAASYTVPKSAPSKVFRKTNDRALSPPQPSNVRSLTSMRDLGH